jgi:hypothetical protein
MVAGGLCAQPVSPLAPLPEADWLIDPSPIKAEVTHDAAKRELAISNGLVRQVFRLEPNVATVDFKNLKTGEQLLRATRPEARKPGCGSA